MRAEDVRRIVPCVFFSYSHRDEDLRNQIETQLAMLKRQGVIKTWHDRRIGAGQELDREIDSHLSESEIVLLLVSPDFIASEYCYEREMARAMRRHEAGEAIVIPVILRACDWREAPFGGLMATPTDGRPVTQWPDRDQAMLEVAQAVRRAAKRFQDPTPAKPSSPIISVDVTPTSAVRSSNLRVAKRFTERDKDAFRIEAFEYMAKLFENSLAELQGRNLGIEGRFRRIDANRFTSVVYRDGRVVASCTIFMGSGAAFGNSICYIARETDQTNSFNDNLSVEADGQSLYLTGSGFGQMRASRSGDERLTPEGGAECFWSMLIQPLQ